MVKYGLLLLLGVAMTSISCWPPLSPAPTKHVVQPMTCGGATVPEFSDSLNSDINGTAKALESSIATLSPELRESLRVVAEKLTEIAPPHRVPEELRQLVQDVSVSAYNAARGIMSRTTTGQVDIHAGVPSLITKQMDLDPMSHEFRAVVDRELGILTQSRAIHSSIADCYRREISALNVGRDESVTALNEQVSVLENIANGYERFHANATQAMATEEENLAQRQVAYDKLQAQMRESVAEDTQKVARIREERSDIEATIETLRKKLEQLTSDADAAAHKIELSTQEMRSSEITHAHMRTVSLSRLEQFREGSKVSQRNMETSAQLGGFLSVAWESMSDMYGNREKSTIAALRETLRKEFEISCSEMLVVGRVLNVNVNWWKRLSEALVTVDDLAADAVIPSKLKNEREFLVGEKVRAERAIESTEASFSDMKNRFLTLKREMEAVGLEFAHPGENLRELLENDRLSEAESQDELQRRRGAKKSESLSHIAEKCTQIHARSLLAFIEEGSRPALESKSRDGVM